MQPTTQGVELVRCILPFHQFAASFSRYEPLFSFYPNGVGGLVIDILRHSSTYRGDTRQMLADDPTRFNTLFATVLEEFEAVANQYEADSKAMNELYLIYDSLEAHFSQLEAGVDDFMKQYFHTNLYEILDLEILPDRDLSLRLRVY